MQGARIWLPNIEGFFTSLGRLLESAEGQRNTASYDSAEFFSRRLRENERTLVTLTLRIEEAFPNEVEVISDLNELVFLMNELSRDFDRIFEDSERSTFTAPSSLNDRLSTVARNGLVGKPRLQILQQQLQTLHNDAGFLGLTVLFQNCFLLGVKSILSYAHKTGSWYLLRVLFKICDKHSFPFYMGVPSTQGQHWF